MEDDEENFMQHVPRGPRFQSLIESTSVRTQLKGHCWIFLSDHDVPVESHRLSDLRTMTEIAGISVKDIRADSSGYYSVFEGSRHGEHEASKCFERFEGAKFYGNAMRLQLHRNRS